MRSFFKILELFTASERQRGIIVLIYVLGMALLDTAGVASIMPFLAVLGDPEVVETHPVLKWIHSLTKTIGIIETPDFLVFLGAAAFVVLVISAIYRTLTQFKLNSFIESLRASFSTRLLETYLSQPYSFFLKRHSAELSKGVLSEIDQLVGSVIRPLCNMLAYAVLASFMVGFLLYLNPTLLGVSFLVLGGSYCLSFYVTKPILDKLGKKRLDSNQARFMTANEALTGFRDLKLHGCSPAYLERYRQETERFASSIALNITISRVPKYLIEAVAFGGIVLLILFLLLSSGGQSSAVLGQILPMVGLYAFAAYRLQPALHFIFAGVASLRFGKAAVDHLHYDLSSGESCKEAAIHEGQQLSMKKSLVVENLCFTYEGSTTPAIKSVTFELHAGTVLGVVGTTGCGKSTLINLLLGLISPDKGSLTADGVAINSQNIQAWHRKVGYVPQDIFLIDKCISENIAFGLPPGEINHAQVEKSARMANIHDFIMSELEDGYDSIVGERGVRLSGGQRQRIGIARALYHDPDLLIFDEATSALDSVVEKAIMHEIENLSKEKTIIIVAHRMNTIKKCNNILALISGEVSCSGTYDQLNETSLYFRSLNQG